MRTWFWPATKKKGLVGWKHTRPTRPRFLRKGFWVAPLESWCTSTACRGGVGGCWSGRPPRGRAWAGQQLQQGPQSLPLHGGEVDGAFQLLVQPCRACGGAFTACGRGVKGCGGARAKRVQGCVEGVPGRTDPQAGCGAALVAKSNIG